MCTCASVRITNGCGRSTEPGLPAARLAPRAVAAQVGARAAGLGWGGEGRRIRRALGEASTHCLRVFCDLLWQKAVLTWMRCLGRRRSCERTFDAQRPIPVIREPNVELDLSLDSRCLRVRSRVGSWGAPPRGIMRPSAPRESMRRPTRPEKACCARVRE